MPVTPKQLFHDINLLKIPPSAQSVHHRNGTNVCLYYGRRKHLEVYPSKGRMGYIDKWNAGYPMIHTFLYPGGRTAGLVKKVSGSKPPAKRIPLPFAICPSFSRSFISKDIAQRFGLCLNSCRILEMYPASFTQLLCGEMGQISSLHSTQVSIQFDCNSQIVPAPYPKYDTFSLSVVEELSLFGKKWKPKELAVLGRDILDYMLLLYRSRTNHGHFATSRNGRVYFGQDTEWQEKMVRS